MAVADHQIDVGPVIMLTLSLSVSRPLEVESNHGGLGSDRIKVDH